MHVRAPIKLETAPDLSRAFPSRATLSFAGDDLAGVIGEFSTVSRNQHACLMFIAAAHRLGRTPLVAACRQATEALIACTED
jgi:hypothetical protein